MTASTALREMTGGLVAALSCLAFSIANGALIYSGALHHLLGSGIAAGLVSTATVAILLALLSTFRPIIGTANSTTGAPLGAILLAAAPGLSHLSDSTAVATVYMVVGVTTVAAGVTLIALGWARLGAIVRFIPFPVVAGFMGVTGTLLLFGAFRLSTGLPIQWARLPELAHPDKARLALAFALFTGALAMLAPRFKHPLILPGVLVATVIVADAAVYALGYSIDAPPVAGFFLAPKQTSVLDLPNLLRMPGDANWHVVASLAGQIAAYVVLVVMATLLTNTGLEAALNVDADYNRELKAQGLAITSSALLGGFVANPSVGSTMAAFSTGARGRLAGVTTGIAMIAFLLLGLRLLPFVPRFVVGGLLGQIAVWIIINWCIATRKKMPIGEWLLVVGIVGITVAAGMVPAIIAGLIGGCVLFALDMSRVDIVRRIYGLNERTSPLVRPAEELVVLAQGGGSVQFVELSGTLFFGSAYQILRRVKELVARDPPRKLVLDLTGVLGCDSSTTAVLARMRRLLAREHTAFAVAGGRPPILALLKASKSLEPADAVYTTRDEALEAAEVEVLLERDNAWPRTRCFEDWLAESLGDADFAQMLAREMTCADVGRGDYLCRQGEPTDSLLFIESGRVAVMVGPCESETCVRIFGPHTIAGEHGFVLRLPRTASLKVEQPARVWSLARKSFDRLQVEKPDLVIALLRDVIKLQSERLAFATRQNVALG